MSRVKTTFVCFFIVGVLILSCRIRVEENSSLAANQQETSLTCSNLSIVDGYNVIWRVNYTKDNNSISYIEFIGEKNGPHGSVTLSGAPTRLTTSSAGTNYTKSVLSSINYKLEFTEQTSDLRIQLISFDRTNDASTILKRPLLSDLYDFRCTVIK